MLSNDLPTALQFTLGSLLFARQHHHETRLGWGGGGGWGSPETNPGPRPQPQLQPEPNPRVELRADLHAPCAGPPTVVLVGTV